MFEKLKTPCYIFDRNDFEKNIYMFMSALNEYFGGKWILGYSFKTNFLPYILECAKESGCYAEVVSQKEYELAKVIGFKKNRIIYNGPVKEKEDFIEAVKNGCIVNVDSKRELAWLSELPKENAYSIGIRVNFDLESELPGHTLMGDEGGRFGFCDDNDELKKAIIRIRSYGNIEIRTLHMHISSKTKSVEVYRHLVRKACAIIDREKLNIEYIDVGGSFFGGGDDGTFYVNYVKAIKEELDQNKKTNLGIIVEPGASVIASSISYLVEVIDDKDIKQNHYVVVDGSRLHIDPFFVRNSYSNHIFSSNQMCEDEQIIVGFTCMEKDRITKVINEKRLMEKDRILFNVVGSYTMCMNSDFISSEPRVYVQHKGQYYLIRDVKTIQSYLDRNILEEIR